MDVTSPFQVHNDASSSNILTWPGQNHFCTAPSNNAVPAPSCTVIVEGQHLGGHFEKLLYTWCVEKAITVLIRIYY